FAGGFRYTDDIVVMALQCATQWDALAHVFYDDQLYNGYPATEVTTRGALKDAIDRQAKGITGRGVLLDVARLFDVPWLEPGHAITAGDLDAACAAQGVELGSGDILMVRTGWRRMFVETADRAAFMGSEPGLGLTCCEWLRDRDVAVVCADNWALEAVPAVDPSVRMPVHMVLIRDMGVTLGEMFDFEELAADCASDGVWECFFCGPPLKVTRGVGSPINPLAIK
ncbi:MAG: cyclase family protein, partial [Acidimicrobiia bacterium]